MADQRRAGDDRTCSAMFHHTTAMGFCSRCGQSWKHRHKPKDCGCGMGDECQEDTYGR